MRFVAVSLLALGAMAYGQAPRPAQTRAEEMLGVWNSIGNRLIAMAEDFPGRPVVSPEQATLYEHCLRAIRHAFRLGLHGLPLMGCGDWNDGMNKVGELGQGESVWVGWFLLVLLDRFLPIMEAQRDAAAAAEWQSRAAALRGRRHPGSRRCGNSSGRLHHGRYPCDRHGSRRHHRRLQQDAPHRPELSRCHLPG